MSPRLVNAVFVGLGAAAGYFLADAIDRRRAEKRTLTEADQRWMATTHERPADA